jgi:hypothetical protein
MKKSVYLFSMLFFLLAAASGCSDWGEEPELNILELESANVSFDEYGGSGEIVAKSTAGVTASSAATWCATAVSGNKVTVTVPSYDELLGRATVVTVVSGGKNVQVPVTQSGLEFHVESTTVELTRAASSITLQVSCRLPITVQSSATWLTASVVAGTALELQATANASFAPRTATVSLTAGILETIITVTQTGLTFNNYIGTWTFTHTTAAATTGTNYNKRALVTNGGGYLVVTLQNGTTPTAATLFSFAMGYNAATGGINIPVQIIEEAFGNYVMLAGFNGSNLYPYNGGMNGTPTSGTFANPVLTFTDDGTGSSNITYIGFILWQINATTEDSVGEWTGFGNASTSRYTNITMTKQ